MAMGTALGWGNLITIIVSVALAFVFGYSLTLIPLLKAVSPGAAFRLALAADTLSIVIMEIVDNLVMLTIPGAMDAGPAKLLFWSSMALSLVLAGLAAYPVNRRLITRGKGHAVVHGAHSASSPSGEKPSAEHKHGHMGHGDQSNPAGFAVHRAQEGTFPAGPGHERMPGMTLPHLSPLLKGEASPVTPTGVCLLSLDILLVGFAYTWARTRRAGTGGLPLQYRRIDRSSEGEGFESSSP